MEIETFDGVSGNTAGELLTGLTAGVVFTGDGAAFLLATTFLIGTFLATTFLATTAFLTAAFFTATFLPATFGEAAFLAATETLAFLAGAFLLAGDLVEEDVLPVDVRLLTDAGRVATFLAATFLLVLTAVLDKGDSFPELKVQQYNNYSTGSAEIQSNR